MKTEYIVLGLIAAYFLLNRKQPSGLATGHQYQVAVAPKPTGVKSAVPGGQTTVRLVKPSRPAR